MFRRSYCCYGKILSYKNDKDVFTNGWAGFDTMIVASSDECGSRENEGTERDIQGVGWDMSIPLKLFLVLGGNGSLFRQTSA